MAEPAKHQRWQTTHAFCKQITWKQQIVTLHLVLPKDRISQRNTLEVRKSALGSQFIRNEAIQPVGRHHHWKCRTSSIGNKERFDVVELCLCVHNHSLPWPKHVSNSGHQPPPSWEMPCIPISPTSSACLQCTASSHKLRSSEDVQRLQPLCRCHAGGHDRAEGHQIYLSRC